MTARPNTIRKPDDSRRFRAALIAALGDAPGEPSKLQRIAGKLIEAALEGDMPAIRDIRDIIDGRPGIVGDTETVSIARIERVIVDPQDQDSAGVPPAAGRGAL